jgi:hypothetical protein
MSTEQRQVADTIAVEITAPGTPQRISASSLLVRSVTVESARLNSGILIVATSLAAAMDPDQQHTLYGPGDAIEFVADPYANLNAEINLMDIWIDGDTSGDIAVVSYEQITGKLI